MLFDVHKNYEITKIPYEKDFNEIISRIDEQSYKKIEEALSELLRTNDVLTSSWIPGNNWDGTPYDPIYYACGCNEELAGKIFGLFLQHVVINNEFFWGKGRYEHNGNPIAGTTYFKLQKMLK